MNRIELQKKPFELTPADIAKIPRGGDQQIIHRLGIRTLTQWIHNPELVNISFNPSQQCLEQGKLLCINYPEAKRIFNTDPKEKYDGSPVTIPENGLIIIPTYPTRQLRTLRNASQGKRHLDPNYEVANPFIESSGEHYFYMLIGNNNVYRNFNDKEFSRAERLLSLAIKASYRDAYYKIALSEELAHLVVEPYSKGAPDDLKNQVDEVLANGLSLFALSRDELLAHGPLVQWSFKYASAIIVRNLLKTPELMNEMKKGRWSPACSEKIRELLRSWFGTDQFDRHDPNTFSVPSIEYLLEHWPEHERTLR